MTKNTKLSYIIALISASALALLFTAFRTLALFGSYNITLNTFEGAAGTVLSVMMCFAVFAIAVYSLCGLRTVRLTAVSHHALTPFSSIFAIVALFIFIAVQLLEFGNSDVNRLLLLTLLVLCVLALPFFIISMFSSEPADERRALSAISCALFFMLLAIVRYISTDLPTASPTKTWELVSLTLIMLFMLYECRIALSRQIWTLYILCGLSCTFVGSVYSVSTLIYMIGKMGVWTVSNEFMASCLLIFAFSVYAGIRMYTALTFRSELEAPPESINDYSDFEYAAHSEADNFTISAERLKEQLPTSTDIKCVSATVQDKIDEGTVDSPPTFSENPDE